MRRYLLAAVAAAAIATPALARDGQPYVGIEGGILFAEDLELDIDIIGSPIAGEYRDAATIELKRAEDIDAIIGYDFGLIRLEAELGYKRLRTGNFIATNTTIRDLDLDTTDADPSDNGRVVSVMANAIADIGNEDGYSAYIGLGAGQARVRLGGDRDEALAYQVIAGVRKSLTDSIDIGLKYRYFRTRDLNFEDDFTDGLTTVGVNVQTAVRTHSLLASLVFNFGAPAPVIVPPVIVEPVIAPPPPATQTCYDGSVILATDVCPQPPMPAPAPERG